MRETVLVLDFGAQYGQLIARRTRELGVYCEIVPHDTPWSVLSLRRPGGADSLRRSARARWSRARRRWMARSLSRACRSSGICYGMQLLARDIGAELVKLDHAEYGPATLRGRRPRDAAL